MTTCLKCGYIRKSTDASPDYECPKCGVVYAKYKPVPQQTMNASPAIQTDSSLKTVVTAGIKRIVKYTVWFLAFCVLVALYGYFNRYLDDRALKKSQTEELARRQGLTPEQRIAEDQAKAAAAAAAARVEARKMMNENGKAACTAHWLSQLKDPYSAILERFEGGVDKEHDDLFFAEISGRAKNSFGAYVPGTWVCSAGIEAGKIKITHFSQLT